MHNVIPMGIYNHYEMLPKGTPPLYRRLIYNLHRTFIQSRNLGTICKQVNAAV